jgi:hypothetical protein
MDFAGYDILPLESQRQFTRCLFAYRLLCAVSGRDPHPQPLSLEGRGETDTSLCFHQVNVQ